MIYDRRMTFLMLVPMNTVAYSLSTIAKLVISMAYNAFPDGQGIAAGDLPKTNGLPAAVYKSCARPGSGKNNADYFSKA